MNSQITEAKAVFSLKLDNGESEEIELIYSASDPFHMSLPVNVYYRKICVGGGVGWFREIKPQCWFEAFHVMRMGETLPGHCIVS